MCVAAYIHRHITDQSQAPITRWDGFAWHDTGTVLHPAEMSDARLKPAPKSPTRKQSKRLLDRAAKYIAKGLESGAYTDTVGHDLFAERLLEQIRRHLAKARPPLADEKHLLDRAAKYIAKGLESGAYTDTVGHDLFAERLLEHVRGQLGRGAHSKIRRYEVRSSTGLEGVFVGKDDALGYADELRSIGVQRVTVEPEPEPVMSPGNVDVDMGVGAQRSHAKIKREVDEILARKQYKH